MNILVFSWRDPKHTLAGGAEQSMHEHMKGWVRAGHKVTLFSSRIINLPADSVKDGIRIIRQGNQYLGVQIKAFLYYLKNKNNFDLIVDQFHGIPFFTPLYVRKPKLAVLQEVAKEVWFKNPLTFPLNYIVGIVGYLSEPFVFLLYKRSKFMVGSNSAKKDLIKFGIIDKNITVVPHGIILPKKIPEHKVTNPKIITFFGRMTPDKGVVDALKTFSILNTLNKYKFYIAGTVENRDYYNDLKTKAKKLGILHNLTFWERPTDKEKFELFAKTFLFINPSIREGWGLVNIEANAMGVPVIAYPSQGLVDSVRDGLSGLITKSKTPDSLATEVDKLKRDMKEYKRLSIGARKWATTFDWKKSRQMSLKLINNLL